MRYRRVTCRLGLALARPNPGPIPMVTCRLGRALARPNLQSRPIGQMGLIRAHACMPRSRPARPRPTGAPAAFRSGLLLHYRGHCGTMHAGEGEKHGGERVMELRAASPRKHTIQGRLHNYCAQCGETIFLPEWSEYLDRLRVRHLWECEACGYNFETLVSFPEPEAA